MKRLTPAMVTLMTVVVSALLATAYVTKKLLAEETPQGTFAPGIMQNHDSEPRPPAGVPTTANVASTPPLRAVIEVVTTTTPTKSATPTEPDSPKKPIENAPLKVAAGMRAVSISLPAGAADIGGLIQSGRHVDVYMTPKQSESHFHGGVTLTLLKGIRVLAAPTENSTSQQNQWVTLELTPQQANILILAREKGTLALSYNPEGKAGDCITLQNPDRATLDDLLGVHAVVTAPTFPATSAAPMFVSEAYKGSQRSLYTFKEGFDRDDPSANPNPSDSTKP